MGAWGYKPFENDDAGEALFEVRDRIEAKLRAALRIKDGERDALAYVEMLVLLRQPPSSADFGSFVAKRIVSNFNAPVRLHTHDRGVVQGRAGDTWNDPKKRLAVITRTVKKWRDL